MATVKHRWAIGLMACGALFAMLLHKASEFSDVSSRAPAGTSVDAAVREGPSEIELEQHAELARAIQQQTPAEIDLSRPGTNEAIRSNTTHGR